MSLTHSRENNTNKQKLKIKRPDPIKVPAPANDFGYEYEVFKNISKKTSRPRLTPMTATTPSVSIYGSELFRNIINTPSQISQFFDTPRTPMFKLQHPRNSKPKETLSPTMVTKMPSRPSEQSQELEEYTTVDAPNDNSNGNPDSTSNVEIRINPSNIGVQDYDRGDKIVFDGVSIVFDKELAEGVRILSPPAIPNNTHLPIDQAAATVNQATGEDPEVDSSSFTDMALTNSSDDDDGDEMFQSETDSPNKPIDRATSGFDFTNVKKNSIVDQLSKRQDVWEKVTKCKKGVYRCNHCSLRFQKLLYFAQHMDEAGIERDFPCDYVDCPWSIIGFAKRSEWSRHMKHQHHDKYKFECKFDECDKVFSRKDSMKRHYLLVHENSASRRNKKLRARALAYSH